MASGTIRVLDAMLLFKNENGLHASVDLEDLPPDQKEALGFIEKNMIPAYPLGDYKVHPSVAAKAG